MTALSPMVQISDVHKFFGDLHVLRGVDLNVERGEVCVILGPSGSGKSTLLRCVNELERISAGRIVVDDELMGLREVEKAGRTQLHRRTEKDVARQRSRIGMVFQRFNLFPHMTALGNVMEAPRKVRRLDKAGGAGEGRGTAGHGGSGRPYGALPSPALRRAAATRRHSACPGDGSRPDALRRTHIGT